MLSVVMLSVVMLSVIMLSVVMLSVVAPTNDLRTKNTVDKVTADCTSPSRCHAWNTKGGNITVT